MLRTIVCHSLNNIQHIVVSEKNSALIFCTSDDILTRESIGHVHDILHESFRGEKNCLKNPLCNAYNFAIDRNSRFTAHKSQDFPQYLIP